MTAASRPPDDPPLDHVGLLIDQAAERIRRKHGPPVVAPDDTPPDKRKKAHPETVDTSNGALFLRIVALEREVVYLRKQLDQHMDNSSRHTIRVGGPHV